MLHVKYRGPSTSPHYNSFPQIVEDYRKMYAYKATLEYIMANTPRDKTIAALNGGGDELFKEDILAMFLDVTQDLTRLEKIMLGWTEV